MINIKGLFKQVKIDKGGYGISWNDNIDLSCNTLWNEGRLIWNIEIRYKSMP